MTVYFWFISLAQRTVQRYRLRHVGAMARQLPKILKFSWVWAHVLSSLGKFVQEFIFAGERKERGRARERFITRGYIQLLIYSRDFEDARGAMVGLHGNCTGRQVLSPAGFIVLCYVRNP